MTMSSKCLPPSHSYSNHECVHKHPQSYQSNHVIETYWMAVWSRMCFILYSVYTAGALFSIGLNLPLLHLFEAQSIPPSSWLPDSLKRQGKETELEQGFLFLNSGPPNILQNHLGKPEDTEFSEKLLSAAQPSPLVVGVYTRTLQHKAWRTKSPHRSSQSRTGWFSAFSFTILYLLIS